MELLNDLHHLAFVTADMNRLLDFYRRVLSAQVIADIEEQGLRHAFIRVGPHTMLHPFLRGSRCAARKLTKSPERSAPGAVL